MSKSKLLIPILFTNKEGGSWIKYEGQGYTLETLEKAVIGDINDFNNTKLTKDSLLLLAIYFDKGIGMLKEARVHSLAFKMNKFGRSPRWDIVNGWTRVIPTPIEKLNESK